MFQRERGQAKRRKSPAYRLGTQSFWCTDLGHLIDICRLYNCSVSVHALSQMHTEKPMGAKIAMLIYHNYIIMRLRSSQGQALIFCSCIKEQIILLGFLIPSSQDVLITKLGPRDWTWVVQSTGYIIAPPSCSSHAYLLPNIKAGCINVITRCRIVWVCMKKCDIKSK